MVITMLCILVYFGICICIVAARNVDVTTSDKGMMCMTLDNSSDLGQSNSCLPWSYCNSTLGYCQCNTYNYILQCEGNTTGGGILSCHCLTYNEVKNLTEEGQCMYNCGEISKNQYLPNEVYTTLPSDVNHLNKIMCGAYNRTGTLCGKCSEGMYLPAYSYDIVCTTCDTNIWSNICKYLLAAFVPLTIFCFFVLMFKINIATSQLQGVVLYCQSLSSPFVVRTLFASSVNLRNTTLFQVTQFLGMLNGIWNLDFFRVYNLQICFPISTLTLLSLDYLIALYPLLVMVITYILIKKYDSRFKPFVIIWQPFYKLFHLFQDNCDIRTSTIDAFSTFMFLSNVKFLNVCMDLLAPVRVYHMPHRESYRYVLYFDATVPYFRVQHVPYAVFAILILVIFVLLPMLILMIYPFKITQRCLHWLSPQCKLVIHIYVDSFQGCFKDGTEPGTKDCRSFSAMPFILHFILFVVQMTTLTSVVYPYFAIVFVITTITVIIVDPYKKSFYWLSNQLIIFILFLAGLSVCTIGTEYYSFYAKYQKTFYGLICFITFLQMMYIFLLIMHWIIIRRNCSLAIINKIKSW